MTTTSPLMDNDNRINDKHGTSVQIEYMQKIPFPTNSFLHYTKVLTVNEKIELVKLLKIDLFKKWSDILFVKKLNIALKKVNSDTKLKKQLMLFISKVMIKNQISIDEYEQHWRSYVAEQQFWPVYWSIYYHAMRAEHEAKIQKILALMQQEQQKVVDNKAQQMATVIPQINDDFTEQEQQKTDKKIVLLEAKLNKETQLRIHLEQLLSKLDKQNRTHKQDIDKHKQTEEQLKAKFNEALVQLEKQDHYVEKLKSKKKEEEERLLQERQNLLQHVKQTAEEGKKYQQQADSYAQQLEELRRQNASLTQANNQLHKQKTSTKLEQEPTAKLIDALQHRLHRRIEKTNNILVKQYDKQLSPLTPLEKRNKLDYLRETLALIEHCERYLQHEELETEPVSTLESLPQQQLVDSPKPVLEEAGIYGTFYRRDHGGFIELEHGESFNITESLVQQLELQHEAEVLCSPNQQSGKHSHYTITIAFQGDDAYSPITQYDGYVLHDANGKWYCVEMNDESRRFPIHFKDVDIQKPASGDPCTFNVANDGYIARLTKLYRLQPGETFESSFPAKKAEKNKSNHAMITKEKREQYLDGCTITIIGGQRKWFESVVTETGAELVHNGGERPERIATDLARSQALFMILTSTSHRATWESIEIAKSNQIPHFTIQGSKSNLRSLLWDNQQIIRETNR